MTRPIVPSSHLAVTTKSGGISTEYQRFFNALPGVGKPDALAPVVPSASPFQYVASTTGTLAIVGGTVSSRTLTRNGVSAQMGDTIPLANGDVVTITYTVVPTVTFVPS